jgi:HD superfamily phosphodiesterase
MKISPDFENKKMNFNGARQYIINRLKNELSPELYYHGLQHTRDVYNAAEKLADMEAVSGQDLILLKTAALFHDAGFIEKYSNNETIAVKIAKQELPEFLYDEREINIIADIIMATDMSKPPETILQKIICDADLDYLGRNDFNDLSTLLKKELYAHGFEYNDQQWDEIQIKFLDKHHYYTLSAIKKNNTGKQKHIEEIKKRFKSKS